MVQVERDAKADLPLWLSETLHKHNLATVHRPNFLGEKCGAHVVDLPATQLPHPCHKFRALCVAGFNAALQLVLHVKT